MRRCVRSGGSGSGSLASSARLGLRLCAAAALAAVAPLGLAQPALGYGMATHAWLAHEEAYRLAASDPQLGFLATDDYARACYVYGATFPDVRSLARQSGPFDTLKAKLEATSFVTRVRFETTDVEEAFRRLTTHDSQFCLALVDAGRARDDRYLLAFALGNLTHVMQDKHAQVVFIPQHMHEHPCGDLGIECVDDPAKVASWYPGYENEIIMEGYGDSARPDAIVFFMKNAPFELAATEFASLDRMRALRHFYWEVADVYVRAQGRTPPTERGIMNGAVLHEISLAFYPFFTGKEPFEDSIRTIVERYVELAWWAAALHAVAQQIAMNLSGGSDLLDLIGPLVPVSAMGGQIAGREPLAEIVFAYAQGGSEQQRVATKYGSNVEFQRLSQSGLLDQTTYTGADYEGAHAIVLDGLLRGHGSLYTDDTIWPTYSRRVMRAAGMRSLDRMLATDGVADAPAVLLYDLRYHDASSGQEMTELEVPDDLGKLLHVEAELFGSDDEPIARVLRLRLRADLGQGALDPVVAEERRLVGSQELALLGYGSAPRPTLSLAWTIQDVPGAAGIYVEVDELRVSPVPAPPLSTGAGAADRLFSSHIERLRPLMVGRPHYATEYDTYGTELGSLRLRR